MTPHLLQMRGIVKTYGELRANDGVDLDVAGGEIVGLLGENGSGKSTLMKVLYGITRADAGGILLRGRELSGHDPKTAAAAGIGMIHQHFMLVDAMTVAENVMLGWDEAGRWLRRRDIAGRIREASARFGLDLDPDQAVAGLSLGRRQRVEILKAVLRGAELLILDEPTSNLSPPEVAGLLGVLRQLRADGRGIVFISHKMAEVRDVCDRVVVLRDGRVTGGGPVAATTDAALAMMMVGRDLSAPLTRAGAAPGRPLLTVEGLGGPGLGGPGLRAVSFTIAAGEVLALCGVDGNGQTELAEALSGLTPPAAGRIVLDGRDITRASVAARMAAGLAYLPADRARTSLVQAMTVAENIGLRDMGRPPFSRARVLDGRALRRAAEQAIARYEIRAPGPGQLVRRLSGGNQQKIAVAREIARAPKVLVAAQATWGLDPGATRFVRERVLALRDAGAAVLYISSELEEVLALGDRIGVMFDGRVDGVTPRAAVDVGRIGLLMAGRAAA